MHPLVALIALVSAVSAELVLVNSTHVYNNECPESCQKANFTSIDEIKDCNAAVTANATSLCSITGNYHITGEDTLFFLCQEMDDNFKYYIVTLDLIQEIPGTLVNTTSNILTASQGFSTVCRMYLGVPTDTESPATCGINKANVTLSGQPYLSGLNAMKKVLLPSNFQKPVNVVADATWTGCDEMKDQSVAVEAQLSLEIFGEGLAETTPSDYAQQVIALSGASLILTLATLN
eukprot:Blabericola_migrator_1__8743@NODE_4602_length_1063_cov_765_024096_g2859_i0_p1_GENE_NODE_4602_length_1063_cov_765_024096_g2859_i0NODE_4602_length_1063_cov_765_024096_g2859_i0_p1_ORF_typecomplete_len234_score51_80_NODE_4602_length_1063_cov_765_024096_g2859_i0212913